MKHALFACALVASACRGGGECAEETDRVAAAFATIPRGGQNLGETGWTPNMLVELDPAIPGADDVPAARILVFVFPTGLRVEDGEIISTRTVADAKDGIEEELERRTAVRGELSTVLVPKWDVGWPAMAVALETLREVGMTEVDVVFWRDVVVPAAPASSITAELETLLREPTDSRASQLAHLAERVVKNCASLQKLFESIATTEPERRHAVLLDGAAAAMRECECMCDVPAAATLIHTLTAPAMIPAVVRLSLAPKGATDAETLTLGGELTWVEAHASVVAARGRPMAYAWK